MTISDPSNEEDFPLIGALIPVGLEIINGHGLGSYDDLVGAIHLAKVEARRQRQANAIPRLLAAEIVSFFELMMFRDAPPGDLEWEAHAFLVELLSDVVSGEERARAWTRVPRRAKGP
jgi:hypothetical protein